MSQAKANFITDNFLALKFTFSDYGFSHFVRARLNEILIQFDVNQNQYFQQEQVRQALVQILNEDPSQLQHIVQNVYRYDDNSDGRISYKQFIDFTVEQHFGEMVIRKLHKEKLYSQGNKKIMNLQQFAQTVEFSLNTIEVYGSKQIYQTLFQEVDLDRDGWISYDDYFTFLKEYFGSLSYANQDIPEPVHTPVFSVDNGAAQRFARLIYAQQKVTTMQVDINKNLYLQAEEVTVFLSQILKLNEYEKEHISKLIFKDKTKVTYDEFLQFIVPFYFCEYFVSQRLSDFAKTPINQQLFVEIVTEACSSFVAVSPSEKTILSIFHLATGVSSELSLEQYVMLMGNIFENYSFDRRGLARSSGH